MSKRDKRGRTVAKRFDRELLRQLSLAKFDEVGLDRVLVTCLRGNESLWEQLEIRRSHAQLALAIAAEHGAKVGELKRRFAAVLDLGFSSTDSQCNFLCFYTHRLTKRGRGQEAVKLLREFAEKLTVQHRETAFMRKFVATLIKDA